MVDSKTSLQNKVKKAPLDDLLQINFNQGQETFTLCEMSPNPEYKETADFELPRPVDKKNTGHGFQTSFISLEESDSKAAKETGRSAEQREISYSNQISLFSALVKTTQSSAQNKDENSA